MNRFRVVDDINLHRCGVVQLVLLLNRVQLYVEMREIRRDFGNGKPYNLAIRFNFQVQC